MNTEDIENRVSRIERMLQLYLKWALVPTTKTKLTGTFGPGPAALNEEEQKELIDLVHTSTK
jgi:hypothetical protein